MLVRHNQTWSSFYILNLKLLVTVPIKLAILVCSPLASAVAPAALYAISGHGHTAASVSSSRGVVLGSWSAWITSAVYSILVTWLQGQTTWHAPSLLKHICCQATFFFKYYKATTDLNYTAQHKSVQTFTLRWYSIQVTCLAQQYIPHQDSDMSVTHA